MKKYTEINLNDSEGKHHTTIRFPSGEECIRIKPTVKKRVILTAKDKNGWSLILLGQAVQILRSYGVEEIILYMPYFPHARQDRVAAEGDPNAVKAYAAMINALGFDRVIVADPHSDVLRAVVDNLRVIEQRDIVARYWYACDHSVSQFALVSPDNGARKKCAALALEFGIPIVECDKTRDPETGALNGFRTISGEQHIARPLWLIDDICDGGGTFLGLAQKLREMGARNITLFVTHGLFTKGLEDLHSQFNRIVTTDSLGRQEDVGTLDLKGLRDELIASN